MVGKLENSSLPIMFNFKMGYFVGYTIVDRVGGHNL